MLQHPTNHIKAVTRVHWTEIIVNVRVGQCNQLGIGRYKKPTSTFHFSLYNLAVAEATAHLDDILDSEQRSAKYVTKLNGRKALVTYAVAYVA